jgi:hypothetical protein
LGNFLETVESIANKAFELIVLLEVEKASNEVLTKFDILRLWVLLDPLLRDCLLNDVVGEGI